MSPATEARLWARVPAEFPTAGGMVEFEWRGQALALCNVEGAPMVFASRCPHGKASLADGVLRGWQVECPLHGGKIDLRDGSPVAPPIRRAVQIYPTRSVEGGVEALLPK